MKPFSLCRIPTALALLAVPGFADTWIVEQSLPPGADFSEIQDAIDVAQDGDVVLVRTGTFYEGFTVDGKSLSIVADEGAHVPISFDVKVRNLGIGQSVTLDGLFISVIGADIVLELEDNLGPIVVQDSTVVTHSIMAFGTGKGVMIRNSLSVTFVDTTVLIGFPYLGAVQDGMRVENSFVAVYRGVVDGGLGGLSSLDGGPGIRLIGSSLLLSDAKVVGGLGGNPFSTPCLDAGDGGSGLIVDGGSSVWIQDSEVLGGAGGETSGGCANGLPGTPIEVLDGTVDTLTTQARGLVTNTPVAVGGTLDVSLQSEAGDTAWILASLTVGFSPFLPDFDGVLMTSPVGFLIEPVGAVPLDGSLEFSLGVGALPGGAFGLVLQGLVFSPSDGFVLSNGRQVTLVE